MVVAPALRGRTRESAALDRLLEEARAGRSGVFVLRAEAGRKPYDKGLTDLVGELSMRSELFRTLWASHDVRLHLTGTKRLHHPVVGDLELTYEAMELPVDQGLTLNVYTAEPGSPSADALNLLASWAATPDQRAAAPDRAPHQA